MDRVSPANQEGTAAPTRSFVGLEEALEKLHPLPEQPVSLSQLRQLVVNPVESARSGRLSCDREDHRGL